jgi:tRNA dimethylallyltransferase
MNFMAQIALIGPTASGKTSLALELAAQHRGVILSLDSLALYRDINIASAKPTVSERGDIPHFGLDLIDPDTPFDVVRFIDSYREAYAFAKKHDRPLIIVGGSGFYLKTLLEGLSPLPKVTKSVQIHVKMIMMDIASAYKHLSEIDPLFSHTIEPSDRYRIEKGLTLFYATGEPPSRWFSSHPPVPIITDTLPIYEVAAERLLLRQRIVQRTEKMLREGLIDEVCSLEHRYTRAPNAMKAIGIIEVLTYLDGRCSHAAMREKIITNTARLAKRQVTFNKSQFVGTIRGNIEELRTQLFLKQ